MPHMVPLFASLLPCLAWAAAPVTTADANAAVAALAAEVKDKGWVVFAARSDKDDWDLHLMRPDGSQRRNITNTPDYNEGYPLLSRDGKRLLCRRIARKEGFDGNRHGAQGVLVLSRSDGGDARPLGRDGEYPWASWSPDGNQIACLAKEGVLFVELATMKTLRTLPRKGFFQQMTWSPDGKWLSGVSNGFGMAWSIGRMNAVTGEVNRVSTQDCCTPDWMPDCK